MSEECGVYDCSANSQTTSEGGLTAVVCCAFGCESKGRKLVDRGALTEIWGAYTRVGDRPLRSVGSETRARTVHIEIMTIEESGSRLVF